MPTLTFTPANPSETNDVRTIMQMTTTEVSSLYIETLHAQTPSSPWCGARVRRTAQNHNDADRMPMAKTPPRIASVSDGRLEDENRKRKRSSVAGVESNFHSVGSRGRHLRYTDCGGGVDPCTAYLGRAVVPLRPPSAKAEERSPRAGVRYLFTISATTDTKPSRRMALSSRRVPSTVLPTVSAYTCASRRRLGFPLRIVTVTSGEVKLDCRTADAAAAFLPGGVA